MASLKKKNHSKKKQVRLIPVNFLSILSFSGLGHFTEVEDLPSASFSKAVIAIGIW